jgi:YD repeat-containing protein
MVARPAWSIVFASVLVMTVHSFVSAPPSGAPVVDTTPYNYAKQDYGLCAVNCFMMLYRQSTVPYFSFDTPRSVTLAYNSDRAFPWPFVLVNVSPDLTYGQTPTEYDLQVKVNGAFVTFANNGEQTLRFTYPGSAPARIGGQIDASSYATGVYPMDILVSAVYSGGAVITNDIVTKFVVVNETNAPIAGGWALAGIQHLYLQSDSAALVTQGDGSAVYFTHSPGAYASPGGEFSKLILSNLSGTNGWARVYPDSLKAVFDNTGKMVQLRDRFNNITAVAYDASARVAKITDPAGLADTLIYGANGLSSIKDPGGRITTVTVDASRKLTAITDPDNVSTSFTFDSFLEMTSIVDRRGDTTTYGYNFSGALSLLTFPPVPIFSPTPPSPVTVKPTESHYPWQEVGVPYSATATTPAPAPLADTVQARIHDSRGYVTSLHVDRFGAITQETDPLGRVTTFTRDTNSLVVRDSFPSGGVDSVAYNASGLPTFEQPAGLSAINLHYAAFGQVDSIYGTGRQTVKHFIGTGGRVDSTSIGGETTSKYTYDTQGRVLTAIDPQGHLLGKQTYSSTNGNLITDSVPGGRVTTRFYDAYGRDTALQQPQTPLRRNHYDLVNRPTQLFDGVNASPTTIAYDSQFVRSVIDPKNQVYSFTFNALGWMTQRTDPAGRADVYLYDRVGDLKRWVNRRGDSLAYSYDAVRRRIEKTGTNTTHETWSFSTDGRVVTTTSPVDTETVYFNVFGQPDSVKTVFAGVSQTYWRRYRYTTAGLIDSVDASGGGIAFESRKYVYNTSVGTLTAIHLAGRSSGLVANNDLQDTSMAFPAGDRVSRQYFPLHSATQLSTGAAYNLTIARSVWFDSLGRIAMQVVGNGATGQRYTYDRLERVLTDSSVNNPAPPASCTGNPAPTIDAYGNSCVEAGGWSATGGTQFAYDAVGNRTDNGGTYGTGNRITAFAGCTYGTDNDGNVNSKICGTDTTHFTWTAENRLASMTEAGTTTALSYDPLGRLVRLDVNGSPSSYFLWDGFKLLSEVSSSGTSEVAEYSYHPGLDRLHAVIVGGHEYNAHIDALGNVIALTDSTETVKRTYQYDAWGDLIGGSDNLPFNNSDRARWKDALWMGPNLANLYYMRNRWYEAHGSGRFLSEDPSGLAGIARAPQSRFVWDGGDLYAGLTKVGTGSRVNHSRPRGRGRQSANENGLATVGCRSGGWNLYEYAANAPTVRSDPTGLFSACEACRLAVAFGLFECLSTYAWRHCQHGGPECLQAALVCYYLAAVAEVVCDQICGFSAGGGGYYGGGGGGSGGGDVGSGEGGDGGVDVFGFDGPGQLQPDPGTVDL